jgi:hypothetical protein
MGVDVASAPFDSAQGAFGVRVELSSFTLGSMGVGEHSLSNTRKVAERSRSDLTWGWRGERELSSFDVASSKRRQSGHESIIFHREGEA